MHHRILKLVKKYAINLSGLTVLTEAASDSYMLNPFIALAAGAKKVICKVKNTEFGPSQEIIQNTLKLALQWKCSDRIIIKEELNEEDFPEVDIVTNSGHLRPITKEQISKFKKTAVIPLMWETWEFRETDLDLKACKEKGVLVLGTNESSPPCDMTKYSALIGIKLLLELGLEICENIILILGTSDTLCRSMKDHLTILGAKVIWFSKDNLESDYCYSHLRNFLLENASTIDGIIVVEHAFPGQLLGEEGYCSFAELYKLNPDLKIGVSCGNIDTKDLKSSHLKFYPNAIKPFGYMTYQSFHVGAMPVMDLFAAGLKVGEVMARARLNGMSVKEAVLYAVQNSPAMDFEGELAWL